VTGSEYPATTLNKLLSSLLFYVQLGLIVFIVFGKTICEKLEMPLPALYSKFEDNKFMVCLALYIVGNMVRNQLLATGAFEIYFDNDLVFSKLQTGQTPSQDVLASLFANYNVL